MQVLTDGTDGVQARLGEYKGEEKEKLINSLKNSSEVSQQTKSFNEYVTIPQLSSGFSLEGAVI